MDVIKEGGMAIGQMWTAPECSKHTELMPSNTTKVNVFDYPPLYAGDIIVYLQEYQPRLLSSLSRNSQSEVGGYIFINGYCFV